MATDEEYLDSLLKSLEENEPQPRTMEQVIKEVKGVSIDDEFPVSSEELADMLDKIVISEGEPQVESQEAPVLSSTEDKAWAELVLPAEEDTFQGDFVLPNEGVNTQEDSELPGDDEEQKALLDMLEDAETQTEAVEPVSMDAETDEGTEPAAEMEELTEALDSLEKVEEQVAAPELMAEMEELLEELPEMPELMDEIKKAEGIEEVEAAEEIEETAPEDTSAIDSAQDMPEAESSQMEASEEAEEDESWKSNIEDLLKSVDEESSAENLMKQAPEESDMDVTELIDQMAETDEDLAEINGLLKKVDSNTSVDDDMLALLEGVEDTGDTSGSGEDEPFDIFGSDEWKDASGTDGQSGPEAEGKKKKKREKKEKGEKREKREKTGKGFLGRKKKATEEPAADQVEDSESGEELSQEVIEELKKNADALEGAVQSEAKPEKTPGIIARFFAFLTKEEEEPLGELDENEQIMNELDEEDKKAGKGKKEKKGKKNKKASQKSEAAEGDEGDIEEKPEADDKKKKRKEKKEKKKKDKEAKAEKVKEKPVKVLSRKNFLLMVAFCATLIACIFALSTFLSEYSDKQNAREAYYHGDYETAYQLLYDKNVSGSDQLIFSRVRTVLLIQRRLDSYENNLKIGREIEAVDSLLKGVAYFHGLEEEEFYDVRDEVTAIYQQICSVLSDSYGITEEEAVEIIGYADDLYTLRIQAAVNGTEFVLPGQEEEVEAPPQPPQDILPEEEEIISY